VFYIRVILTAFLLLSGTLTGSLPSDRGAPAMAAPLPCVAGRSAAATGFWTWPSGSKVRIYLREPDFSAAEIPAVKTAVENWDIAAAENGSQVRFSVAGLTKDTMISQGELTLVRGDIYGKKLRHLALLEAHSLKNDQLINYCVVVVDLSVKKPEVLTNVIAHELGHSLGLMDCYQCHSGTTAMGLLKSANTSNGIEGPTPCDTKSVLEAYQQLKIRISPAPADAEAAANVDDGEEPVADDTPIVPRNRPPQ
jgi:hypothetical protein